MSLQHEIVRDLMEIEDDLNNPYFSWNGATYFFIPSISDFRRDLDTGGFRVYRLLTATVPLFNIDDNQNLTALFNTGTPQPQQIIMCSVDGNKYRIESAKFDPTNSYLRIIAHSTTSLK